MKLRFLLQAVVALTLLCQVTTALAEDPQLYRRLAAWYKGRDPVADAAKNFEKEDVYLISAMGAGGHYYPGMKWEEAERLRKKHDERMVRHSSDVIENKEHGIYLDVALKYAADYNQATAKLLKSAGKD